MPVPIYRLLLITLVILAPISVSAALININTAPASDLETLNGIGPTYSKRIIDYRTSNGLFRKIEDIKNVSGIGDATYAKIKDYITVGDTSAAPTIATTTESNTSSNTTLPVIKPNSSYTVTSPSAHFSATPVNNAEEKVKISVSAGRERLGSVGSPLEFKAESNSPPNRLDDFRWSFGDGSVAYGEVVTHAYEFAGDYTLILNFSTGEGRAVSRTSVMIVEPNLSITYASVDRIEIKNNSQYELSLFGRSLWTPKGVFTFPQDTIIKPNQSISFSSKITGIAPNNLNEVQIMNPNNLESEKLNRISHLENRLTSLKQQLSNALPATVTAVAPSLGGPTAKLSQEQPNEASTTQIQTASAKQGWFETIKRFFSWRK
ncbi:MAG TPA: helix-hairpin-helix domain-containing protein [Candidatus Paceibacterota bacterium]